jgi:hypothetical protein
MKVLALTITLIASSVALADISASQTGGNGSYTQATTIGSAYTQSSGTGLTSTVLIRSDLTSAYRKMVVVQAQPDAAEFFRTGVKTALLQESLAYLRIYNKSVGNNQEFSDEELAAQILLD